MKWLIVFGLLIALLTSCSAAVPIPTTPTITASMQTKEIATAPRIRGPTPTPLPTCTIHVGSVYLRRGAGMRFEAIRVLHAGEILHILKRSAWLQVIDEAGRHGFVSARYCR